MTTTSRSRPNPLTPVRATIVAQTYLAKTRQPIELESYANTLKMPSFLLYIKNWEISGLNFFDLM